MVPKLEIGNIALIVVFYFCSISDIVGNDILIVFVITTIIIVPVDVLSSLLLSLDTQNPWNCAVIAMIIDAFLS